MTEIQRSHGGMFVQLDEDDLFFLLTCTGVGDVTLPKGDVTPVYCPDPASVGNFKIVDSIEGEPGFNTYSLIRPLRSALNYLLVDLRKCTFHGRINWRQKGSTPDDFNNYQVGLHLHRSRVSQNTLTQPVVHTPGDNERVDTNADVDSFDWTMVYPVLASRITLTETEAINDVAFDLSEACNDEEIGGDSIGKDGYFSTDFLAASAANIADFWYSTDYGVTWTDTSAEPFAGGESQGAVVTRGGRVIVARLTPDVANPAEIAYSDDYGVTWTNVDVGSTNGQVILDMTWLDQTHLWAVATGGYIYFSDDEGASWTAQESGGTVTDDLNAIHAYDQNNVFAVGDSAAILKTTDGSTWQTVTAPAGLADNILDVEMRNTQRVFITTDGAEMYVTEDQGTTWTERTIPGQSSLSTIDRIEFDPDLHYFGYLVANTAAPVGSVYRSEDGGASWVAISNFPTNAGLNALQVIDANTAWVGGEPQGGTAFLAKIQQVS